MAGSSQKSEAAAMQVAYEALRGQDRAAEIRMLAWIGDRLDEERRAREASQHAGSEPAIWALNGQPVDYWHTDLNEALNEIEASFGDVVEAAGYAVVEQKFLAIRLDDDGPRYESFDTRTEAEDYIADLQEYFSSQVVGPKLPDDMESPERAEFAAWWGAVFEIGGRLDEGDRRDSSEAWLTRFRAKMAPADAIAASLTL